MVKRLKQFKTKERYSWRMWRKWLLNTTQTEISVCDTNQKDFTNNAPYPSFSHFWGTSVAITLNQANEGISVGS